MAPQLKACAQWDMDSDADAGAIDPTRISLTGTVEEILRGPWSCNSALGRGDFHSALGQRPWRFRVSDGERSAWAGVLLPWNSPLVTVGDRVSVEYEFESNEYGPSSAHFLARSEDGSSLVWVADAASTRELTPPPDIEVRDADDSCTAVDECGSFTRRGFQVAIGENDVLLAYGQRADVHSYAALHLANDQQLGSSTGCTHGFVAHSGLAVVRGNLAQLAARDRECGDASCPAGEYCELPSNASCDHSSAAAECAAAPADCPEDCPGVCGCDGRFHCNACRAAKAGVDVADGDSSCKTPACDGTIAASGDRGCFTGWLCFGIGYEIRCTPDGAAKHCSCSVDQEVTHRFEDALADCSVDRLAVECGFPPPSYGL